MSYSTTDPIVAHRELQRQLQSGALTPAEYRAAFRVTDAAHSYPWCCESPGCQKPATARQNDVAYCAHHWMEARRV